MAVDAGSEYRNNVKRLVDKIREGRIATCISNERFMCYICGRHESGEVIILLDTEREGLSAYPIGSDCLIRYQQ